MSERLGNWIQTYTGRRFYPRDPRASDIAIEDIAHALSMVCRFGGHVPVHYSVAEHSVRVCDHVSDLGGSLQECRWALLHDATEAYLGDIVYPLKQSPEMAGYAALEAGVERAIVTRFGLAPAMPARVKRADVVLLATEKRDVVRAIDDERHDDLGDASARGWRWYCDDVDPLPERIAPWSGGCAEMVFLARFAALFLEAA